MKKELFISKVDSNGNLQANVSKQIRNLLKSFADSSVVVEIAKKRKHRSNNQNRYYWSVVVQYFKQGVLEMWGENIDSQQAHEYLKLHCNYKELINESTGEVIKLPKSTTENNTLEFEEYLDRCRKLIYEYFNIVVPLPNEQSELCLT